MINYPEGKASCTACIMPINERSRGEEEEEEGRIMFLPKAL